MNSSATELERDGWNLGSTFEKENNNNLVTDLMFDSKERKEFTVTVCQCCNVPFFLYYKAH